MFIYPIYNHNWRNINTIYIYNKISIKRNILTIKQNTSGSRWDKDLSAPLLYHFCNTQLNLVRLLTLVLCCTCPSIWVWIKPVTTALLDFWYTLLSIATFIQGLRWIEFQPEVETLISGAHKEWMGTEVTFHFVDVWNIQCLQFERGQCSSLQPSDWVSSKVAGCSRSILGLFVMISASCWAVKGCCSDWTSYLAENLTNDVEGWSHCYGR
jgi:hypothetical protein